MSMLDKIKDLLNTNGKASETHISVLGFKVKDKVTGFTGIISSVSFYLHGCVQYAVTPPANNDGEIKVGNWFNENRIEVIDAFSIIDAPNFSEGYVADGKKVSALKPQKES